MKKLTRGQAIELFKSGQFTIVYWDNEAPTVYEKLWDINEEQERDDYDTLNKFEVEIDAWSDGYCPDIVSLLAAALGGRTDSI